jgi:hypothetical protein
MQMLINSDLSDAFQRLTHLSHIVIACPVGTAGNFILLNYFNQTYNRVAVRFIIFPR